MRCSRKVQGCSAVQVPEQPSAILNGLRFFWRLDQQYWQNPCATKSPEAKTATRILGPLGFCLAELLWNFPATHEHSESCFQPKKMFFPSKKWSDDTENYRKKSKWSKIILLLLTRAEKRILIREQEGTLYDPSRLFGSLERGPSPWNRSGTNTGVASLDSAQWLLICQASLVSYWIILIYLISAGSSVYKIWKVETIEIGLLRTLSWSMKKIRKKNSRGLFLHFDYYYYFSNTMIWIGSKSFLAKFLKCTDVRDFSLFVPQYARGLL